VARAAAAAGRVLPDPFPLVNLLNVVVLDPGEDVLSDRVLTEHGPFVASSMHYLFESVRQYDREPPRHLLDVWERYSAMLERAPEHTRHLRIHEGHCTFLLDEERPLITPELVRATTIVGTADECIAQIRELEAAGVDELVVLPAMGAHEAYAERLARTVMARY